MLHLPVDILLIISSLLAPSDKLECMTVCRQWYNIIHDRSLYRAVYIQRQQQLDSLMDQVKKNPFLGEQVERIRMKFVPSGDFINRLSSKLLPNVRVFESLGTRDSVSSGSSKLQQPYSWYKHIEHVREIGSDIYISAVLSSGICQKLTSISIAKKSFTAGCNIFKLLENAPMLSELHLKNYTVTIRKLEILHSKLKHLTSLKLECVFFCRIDRFPDIESAASVKKFDGYISSYDDNYIPYCQYISKKYTQLEELKIKIRKLRIHAENEEEQKAILISYLKTLAPYLKTLKLVFIVDKIGDPENNEDEDEDEDEDPDESPTGYFRFDMLDECGCQIEKIEIGILLDDGTLYELSTTTQARSIQSLTVDYMTVNTFGRFHFGWLRSFTILTELTLSFDVHPWHEHEPKLVDLLDGLREIQLETLRLYSMKFVIDSSTTHTFPSLKYLTIAAQSIEAGVDSAINQLFPNLKRLMVRGRLWETKSFSLSSLNLSYLQLFQSDRSAFSSVLVHTLDNNQKRIYTWTGTTVFHRPDVEDNGNDLIPLSSARSQPYDRSKHRPDITIVCKSLSEFNMTKEND